MKRSDVTRSKQGYIRPPPHTSFCETQWRLPVKTRLYKTPSSILHCISQLGENKEVKVIEFLRYQTPNSL